MHLCKLPTSMAGNSNVLHKLGAEIVHKGNLFRILNKAPLLMQSPQNMKTMNRSLYSRLASSRYPFPRPRRGYRLLDVIVPTGNLSRNTQFWTSFLICLCIPVLSFMKGSFLYQPLREPRAREETVHLPSSPLLLS